VSDTDSPEGSDAGCVPPPSTPPQQLQPSPLAPTQPLPQQSPSPRTHRAYRMVCLDCEATLEAQLLRHVPSTVQCPACDACFTVVPPNARARSAAAHRSWACLLARLRVWRRLGEAAWTIQRWAEIVARLRVWRRLGGKAHTIEKWQYFSSELSATSRLLAQVIVGERWHRVSRRLCMFSRLGLLPARAAVRRRWVGFTARLLVWRRLREYTTAVNTEVTSRRWVGLAMRLRIVQWHLCRRSMACTWHRLAYRLAYRCELPQMAASSASPPVSLPAAPATADPFLRNLPSLVLAHVCLWLVLAAAAAILILLLVTHHPPSYFITAAALIVPTVIIRASVSHGAAEAAARVARGPRGEVLSSADLRRTRVLREGAHAGGLASRVRGGMGAIGERALLARTRRDEIGDQSREVVPAGSPPYASPCSS